MKVVHSCSFQKFYSHCLWEGGTRRSHNWELMTSETKALPFVSRIARYFSSCVFIPSAVDGDKNACSLWLSQGLSVTISPKLPGTFSSTTLVLINTLLSTLGPIKLRGQGLVCKKYFLLIFLYFKFKTLKLKENVNVNVYRLWKCFKSIIFFSHNPISWINASKV